MKEQIKGLNSLSGALYKLRVGSDEFDKFKNNRGVGRILLDSESAAVWNVLNGSNENRSFDLVRLQVDELMGTNDEVSLRNIIRQSRKMGLKFCGQEMVFCMAVRMLEDNDVGLVNIPTEIDGLLRVFSVEKDGDGDVEIGLYDKDLMTSGSLFEGRERFLFDK